MAKLFANDFGAGTTYRFDLTRPGDPTLLGSFTTAGPYAYPHSFVRLANGNRLATYQKKIDGSEPGGLAELSAEGTTLRWGSAAPASGDSTQRCRTAWTCWRRWTGWCPPARA